MNGADQVGTGPGQQVNAVLSPQEICLNVRRHIADAGTHTSIKHQSAAMYRSLQITRHVAAKRTADASGLQPFIRMNG